MIQTKSLLHSLLIFRLCHAAEHDIESKLPTSVFDKQLWAMENSTKSGHRKSVRFGNCPDT